MLDDAMNVAQTLVARGYSRSEAMPASTWRREGWPEDEGFFKLTDALVTVLRRPEMVGMTLTVTEKVGSK